MAISYGRGGPYDQKRALAIPLAIPSLRPMGEGGSLWPYDQKSVWPSLQDRTAPSVCGRPTQRGTAPLNASPTALRGVLWA
jgi:hypothetical protein